MPRSALIDITKIVASQIIVLHHLVVYSPMSEWLTLAWPRLLTLIADHGPLAVQPFLVIGGFLAAQSVLGRGAGSIALALWQRYLRLLPQLAVALLLVMLSTAWVGRHLSHLDWLSPQPSIGVLLAHLLLLQDVLGVPSISAGAWYVAVDLQLFAVALLLARLASHAATARRLPVLLALVSASTALSLLLFNREPKLDVWAIYFLGAYGLGMLAGLAQRHPAARPWLAALLGLVVLDLVWEPRLRPLLAGAMALALLPYAARPRPQRWPRLAGPLRYLSDISYSVFVCHFAVIILFSGWWQQGQASGLAAAAGWALLAWLSALAVGAAVQALIERRGELLDLLRLRPAAPATK